MIQCHLCGSSNVRKSDYAISQTAFESFVQWIKLIRWYRCIDCDRRFLDFKFSRIDPNAKVPADRS